MTLIGPMPRYEDAGWLLGISQHRRGMVPIVGRREAKRETRRGEKKIPAR